MLKVPVREGVENNVIHDTEHDRRSANTQCQSENRGQRKAAVLEHTSPGMRQVAKEILEAVFYPRFAAVLLDLLKPAKGQVGLATRFFRRKACRSIVADALLQVEA